MTDKQPKPKRNDNPATWGLVQGDLLDRGEHDILGDIAARHIQGMRKYGTPLQSHNGRDSVRDAYEEAMDLVVYLKNAIQELPPLLPPGKDHRTLSRLYHQAIGMMCALKDYQVEQESIRKEREELEGQVVIHPYRPEPNPTPISEGDVQEFQKAREAFREAKYSKPLMPQEASVLTPWVDDPSRTHEAHTGHPGAFDGMLGVEVANQAPTVFIPDQIQGPLREDLEAWKANMEASLEAERKKHQQLTDDYLRNRG